MSSLKVLSVLAALAFVSASALNLNLPGIGDINAENRCDGKLFNTSTTNLAHDLGFLSTAFWSDPERLQRNLFVKYGQETTINQLTSVCNAFNNFYTSLGVNIRWCLGPLGFVRRGVSPYDAFSFDGILRQNRFQCGAGYYISEYHQGQMFNCLSNTFKNSNDKLANATRAYRTNVQHDEHNACKYAVILQKTYAQAFGNAACAKVDRQLAAYWGCEGQSNFISAQFPTCVYDNQCQFGTVLKETEEYAKINEHGELMIYIPPVWNKKANGERFQEPAKWI